MLPVHNVLQPDQYYDDVCIACPVSKFSGEVEISKCQNFVQNYPALTEFNDHEHDGVESLSEASISIYSDSESISESESEPGSIETLDYPVSNFQKVQNLNFSKCSSTVHSLSSEEQNEVNDLELLRAVTHRHWEGIRKLGKALGTNHSPFAEDSSLSSRSSRYSSNEKAHLQQRLKSLSSELVSLRNHLHVNNSSNGQVATATTHQGLVLGSNPPPGNNHLPPIPNGYNSLFRNSSSTANARSTSGGYTKPLPPRPTGNCRAQGLNNAEVIPRQTNASNLTQNQFQSSNFYVNQQFPKDVQPSDPGSTDRQSKYSSSNTNSSGDLTPSVSSGSCSYKGIRSCQPGQGQKLKVKVQADPPKKVPLSAIEDLIHLPGALTEDALIRSLQARCTAGKHFVYMGPILLLANSFSCTGNALTINSTKTIQTSTPIQKVVREALRQQADTGYPQAIILSGCSGSGKTFTSMLVLRQLFEEAGAGLESDAFKHLTASVTVIRSLGTARTASNAESSRIGNFVEVQVTDGSLYRTKVHCYFLDQTRVVRTLPDERNYHIFYQMLAGLNSDERSRLHLTHHSAKTLRYLNSSEHQSNETEDAKRFLDWKTCLCVLGIPFLDVLRVLSAVVLIGNVKFKDSTSSKISAAQTPSCLELEVEEGESELQSAASLLGVSEIALRQGLTVRTHNARGHLIRSRCDANLSNTTRDALAKSLYCRTVATIVRRANSLKRLNSHSGTLSSDSADSVNNQAEVASQHASTVGTAGSKASKSMTALMAAVRHATDGFIGVLDMFGFEDIKRSRLEHLCINLCAETMQHFYNTHIFKACIESCREEGIRCDEIEYHDNVPCIDLISSLRTGLLSMLDVECSVRGTVESYVQKVQIQHTSNSRFLESRGADQRSFAIHHYSAKVYYDATNFLETNRDVLADDLVAVFHKHRCSFGFASHLFTSELKVLGAGGTVDPCPKGISFRIQPTSNTEMLNGEEPVSTLTQDFHTRLDNLLRTLVHTKPHFIRCLKINENEHRDLFDRHTVSKQLRAFQVLETVNLMTNGYPHRMRFKAFNSRYKLTVSFEQLSKTDDHAIEDAQRILDTFEASLDSSSRDALGNVSMGWAIGKRHVFLSEGARQQLENLRQTTRNRAATTIQASYRGWNCRRRWRHLIQQRCRQRAQMSKVNDPAVQIEVIDLRTDDGINAPSREHNILNTAKFQGNGDSGMLRQAFPVPSQRTSSAAVVSSCSQAQQASNTGSTNTGSTQNYKNLPAVIHGNSQGQGSTSGVNLTGSSDALNSGRPRPQPIACTPPPEAPPVINQAPPKMTQSVPSHGVQLEKPPLVPPSRSYTIIGNKKYSFPQTRTMRRNFPSEDVALVGSNEVRLQKGEQIDVAVIGPSLRRGHLIVEYKNRTLHLPYQLLHLRPLNN